METMKMREKAEKIACMAFDVDGTLTDGRIYMGVGGEAMKAFHVKDGLAIRLAAMLGYKTAIITGRESAIVERRAEELAISHVVQGAMDKKSAMLALCDAFSLPLEAIAYMGDDLNDLAALKLAGLAAAPSDAVEEVKSMAHFVAESKGGEGAARELVEFILRTQGRWPDI